MRREDRAQARGRHSWVRHVFVAVLAVAALVLVIHGGAATQRSSDFAPNSVSSGSMAPGAHVALPDATVVQTTAHLGHLVTTHRVTASATALTLLLPLLLLACRRPVIPVAVSVRRRAGGTPLRRGPPTFLAR